MKIIGKIKGNKFILMTVIYLVITVCVCAVTYKTSYGEGSEEPVYVADTDYTVNYANDGLTLKDITLDKGIYAFTIAYEANGFANLKFESDAPGGTVSYNDVLLTPYTGYMEPTIYVYDESADISADIQAVYPDMTFRILAINIRRLNRQSATCDVVRLLMLLAVLYLILYIILKYRGFTVLNPKKSKSYGTLILLLTIMVISLAGFIPGLNSGFIAGGHDVEAHMGRIAAIADGLTGHIFPVRMYRYFANDYGYPMGIFYGDILLYPEALLHILGLPLWQCYVVYAVLISILTAIISYKCFAAIAGDEKIGMLACGAYCLSPWRLNDVYVRAAAGEYAAMAFLPLIAFGIYALTHVVDNDPLYNKRRVRRSVMCLILGFTGIIHTHMITCVMTVIFTALFCLIYLGRLIRNRRILPLIAAGAGTFMLNLSFIVPFADYYLSEDYVVKHLSDKIGAQGAYIRQMITLMGDYTEISYPTGDVSDLVSEMPLSVGPLLVIVLTVLIATTVYSLKVNKTCQDGRLSDGINSGNKDRVSMGLTLSVLLILSIWLASRYFPYGTGEGFSLTALIFGKVQFPWRYLVMVTLIMCLAIIYVYDVLKYIDKASESITPKNESDLTVRKRTSVNLRGLFTVSVLVLTIIQASVFICRQQAADNKHVNATNVYGVYTGLIDSDIMYLPEGMDAEMLKDRLISASSDDIQIQDMGFDGREYTVGVVNTSDTECWVKLPLTYYKGYKAYLFDSDTALGEADGIVLTGADDHRLMIKAAPGYSGILNVRYKEPWYWRFSEAITGVMIALSVIYIFRSRMWVSGDKAGNEDEEQR